MDVTPLLDPDASTRAAPASVVRSMPPAGHRLPARRRSRHRPRRCATTSSGCRGSSSPCPTRRKHRSRWPTAVSPGAAGSRWAASSPPGRPTARRACTSAPSCRRRPAVPRAPSARAEPVPRRAGRARPGGAALVEQVAALGQSLLGGIALGLGLDRDWFAHHLTADPTVLFRVFHYPPGDDGDVVGRRRAHRLRADHAPRAGPHGGLQVRSRGQLDRRARRSPRLRRQHRRHARADDRVAVTAPTPTASATSAAPTGCRSRSSSTRRGTRRSRRCRRPSSATAATTARTAGTGRACTHGTASTATTSPPRWPRSSPTSRPRCLTAWTPSRRCAASRSCSSGRTSRRTG